MLFEETEKKKSNQSRDTEKQQNCSTLSLVTQGQMFLVWGGEGRAVLAAVGGLATSWSLPRRCQQHFSYRQKYPWALPRCLRGGKTTSLRNTALVYHSVMALYFRPGCELHPGWGEHSSWTRSSLMTARATCWVLSQTYKCGVLLTFNECSLQTSLDILKSN